MSKNDEPSVMRMTEQIADLLYDAFKDKTEFEVYVALRMFTNRFEEALGDRRVAICEERYHDLLYTRSWEVSSWTVC